MISIHDHRIIHKMVRVKTIKDGSLFTRPTGAHGNDELLFLKTKHRMPALNGEEIIVVCDILNGRLTTIHGGAMVEPLIVELDLRSDL